MPTDRSVTLTHLPYTARGREFRLALEPTLGAISITEMTREEAINAFFMLGDQLGYTYAKHKSTAEKVEEAVRAGVQTALSGAAVATLSDMGYSWQGSERWKPPLGQKPDFDLIHKLEVAMNGAKQADYFEQQMKFHAGQRVKGIEFLDTVQLALGLQPGESTEAEIVPAIKALRTRITVLTQQAQQQDEALKQSRGDAHEYGKTIVAVRKALDLGLSAPDHIIVSAIEGLKGYSDGLESAAEELQRSNGDMAKTLMGVYEELGLVYDPSNEVELLATVAAIKKTLDRVYEAMGLTPGSPNLIGAIIAMASANDDRGRTAGVQQERKRVVERLWLAHSRFQEAWSIENATNGHTTYFTRLCGSMDAIAEMARTIRDFADPT